MQCLAPRPSNAATLHCKTVTGNFIIQSVQAA